jgi:hypothetical protein
MVDMFFSCLTSGKPSIFLCGAQKVNLSCAFIGFFPYFILRFFLCSLIYKVFYPLATTYPQVFHQPMACG